MNWPIPPVNEKEAHPERRIGPLEGSTSRPEISVPPIRVEKVRHLSGPAGAPDLELFCLHVGEESIQLHPYKNWSQLDHHKWTVRGRLPGSPAGLEITPEHVKLIGEVVLVKDPHGAAKLEKLFGEWLALEQETLASMRRGAQARARGQAPSRAEEPRPMRFQVEVDKSGQVHIHCTQGLERVASVGLSQVGFAGLYNQGLMRRPRVIHTGALHDWVELDGVLCNFRGGENDAQKLEQLLNRSYLPPASTGLGKEIVFLENAASATGYDIQFPVVVSGVSSHHRYHLDEQALNVLMDPDHCGLLHRNIILKLVPPNLVIKRKTGEGGEEYLPRSPEHMVRLRDPEGNERHLDLAQPMNLLHTSIEQLNAVFNHPALNQLAHAAPPQIPVEASNVVPLPSQPLCGAEPPTIASHSPASDISPPSAPREEIPRLPPRVVKEPGITTPSRAAAPRPQAAFRRPNLWLGPLLVMPTVRHDWFATLLYTRMAEKFENSSEGTLGPWRCWSIALGSIEDLSAPGFKGVFLTEKGSLGFRAQGNMARFCTGAIFIGTELITLEAVGVHLIAVGLDQRQRLVFILNDDFEARFGVQPQIVGEVLNALRDSGALLLGQADATASADPIELVWTVPPEQEKPEEPQVLESTSRVIEDYDL